jgi:hypothetical protein
MVYRDFLQSRDAWYLFNAYLFAVCGPIVAADGVGQPGVELVVAIAAVMLCIYLYDAVQGWRRGSRARLLFKGLGPIAVMLLSCVLWWAGVWNAFLAYTRGGTI